MVKTMKAWKQNPYQIQWKELTPAENAEKRQELKQSDIDTYKFIQECKKYFNADLLELEIDK